MKSTCEWRWNGKERQKVREETEKTAGITKLKWHNVVWHNEYSEVLHHEYASQSTFWA